VTAGRIEFPPKCRYRSVVCYADIHARKCVSVYRPLPVKSSSTGFYVEIIGSHRRQRGLSEWKKSRGGEGQILFSRQNTRKRINHPRLNYVRDTVCPRYRAILIFYSNVRARARVCAYYTYYKNDDRGMTNCNRVSVSELSRETFPYDTISNRR